MTKITQGYKILLHSNYNSPLQLINDSLLTKHRLIVHIKRDDLIHPQISGNKWRKLKYNLEFAKLRGYQEILSFGGAYSNHIHALAYAGQHYGLKTIGIIRGEYDVNNPTIEQVKAAGMKVKFISRKDYKQRFDDNFLAHLKQIHPKALIIPEGGSNEFALKGLGEMVKEIPPRDADYIVCPCGSGGTSAGILKALSPDQRLLSIAVLKNADYLKEEIFQLAGNNSQQLEFKTEFHQGGYGKVTSELINFIDHFYENHNIQLEPIYSGKMMMGFYELVKQGFFQPNTRITLIHTGGLQGLNGMIQRKLVPQEWIENTENNTNSDN